jgi:tRNA (cytidine/uridine-2'-O-)-methyltransferase
MESDPIDLRGLPEEIRAEFDASHRLRLPMLPESRSLNLSNSVTAVIYEAWRQNDFQGAV